MSFDDGWQQADIGNGQDNEKSKDKTLVSLNTDAVLTEVERMGAGLVSGITVQV